MFASLLLVEEGLFGFLVFRLCGQSFIEEFLFSAVGGFGYAYLFLIQLCLLFQVEDVVAILLQFAAGGFYLLFVEV